jgi:hypothetical protein
VSKAGLIILILGVVGALLGGGVLLVSLLLPSLTDGRTSWDEAMFGIIPGAIALIVSFVAVAGLVMMIVKRKRSGGAEERLPGPRERSLCRLPPLLCSIISDAND